MKFAAAPASRKTWLAIALMLLLVGGGVLTWRRLRPPIESQNQEQLRETVSKALEMVGQERPREAENILRRILSAQQQLLGNDAEDVLHTLQYLDSLLWRQHDYAGVEEMRRAILQLLQRTKGPGYVGTMHAQMWLTHILFEQGKSAEARVHAVTAKAGIEAAAKGRPNAFLNRIIEELDRHSP